MFNAKLVVILSVAFFGLSIAAESSPTVQELCALVPGTTILSPNSCTNWIKCPSSVDDHDDFEEGSCVFSLYFNKETAKCQYKDEVVCPFEAATVKNRCSRIADGNYIADESNCNMFIYCKDGEEHRSSCPGELVFDPKSGSCVYKNQYTCPAPKPVKEVNSICLSLPNNVTFANQHDCTKYDYCLDNSLMHYDCPANQGWDYLKSACVPLSDVVCLATAKKPEPENTICGDKEKGIIVGPISDGISCSGFYICKSLEDGSIDRHPEHFTCSSDTFFDSSTLSCRNRLNVKCTLDRCEGMGSKYVNIVGDCKSYAKCEQGVSMSTGICPNSYFFDERTQGCTPLVVSYAACSA